MRLLKKSTARNVMVFMVDSSDHVTGKPSLTLTITSSKDGGAFGSISPSVTERGSGWYSLALTSDHTDTLGDLALHVTGSGADPTDVVSHVVAYDFADTVRLGLTSLPNVPSGSSGAIPTTGTGANQIAVSSGGVTLADGVAHGGTPGSSTATLALKYVELHNTGALALKVTSDHFTTIYLENSAGGQVFDIESFGTSGGGFTGPTIYVYGNDTGVQVDADCALRLRGYQGLLRNPGQHNAVRLEVGSSGDDAVYVSAAGTDKHGLFVTSSGGDAAKIQSTASGYKAALNLAGPAAGVGLAVDGGDGIGVTAEAVSGSGCYIVGPANGPGLYIQGGFGSGSVSGGPGLLVTGGDGADSGVAGEGVKVSGGGGSATVPAAAGLLVMPGQAAGGGGADGIVVDLTLGAGGALGHAVALRANGADKNGLLVTGGADGSAMKLLGNGAGAGLAAYGGATGHGADCRGGATSGHGLLLAATSSDAASAGLDVEGGGPAARFLASSNGSGVIVQGAGNGLGLSVSSGGVQPALLLHNDGGAHAALQIENTVGPGVSVLGAGSSPAVQLGDGSGGAEGLKIIGANSAHDVSLAGDGMLWDGINDRPVQVLSDRVMFSGVLGDQSLGDVDHIILPSGPAGNAVLTGSRLRITAGAGQYQERTITDWDGTTKFAGIDQTLVGTVPTAGDSFQVLYDNAPGIASGSALAISHVSTIGAVALGQFFNLDSGETYASAVAGSVVKEVAANAGGTVSLDLTQAIPVSNTANTVGDCLNAARVQGFGKWVIDGNAETLTLYAPDGATVVRTFTLDSVTAPTQRV